MEMCKWCKQFPTYNSTYPNTLSNSKYAEGPEGEDVMVREATCNTIEGRASQRFGFVVVAALAGSSGWRGAALASAQPGLPGPARVPRRSRDSAAPHGVPARADEPRDLTDVVVRSARVLCAALATESGMRQARLHLVLPAGLHLVVAFVDAAHAKRPFIGHHAAHDTFVVRCTQDEDMTTSGGVAFCCRLD